MATPLQETPAVSSDDRPGRNPNAVDGLPPKPQPQYFWLWVMCLLGVDYFSTLAYQPSITFLVAGRLGPLATAFVVAVTLFGVLPVYFYVASKSAHGQGSIALLERFVQGWVGKTMILFLLGFAATDFIMIKSLSLADAAQHVTRNRFIQEQKTLKIVAAHVRDWTTEYVDPAVGAFFTEQIVVTILLGLIGFWFWWVLRRGFNRNVLFWAVPVVVAYLALNAIIVGAGLRWLWLHPDSLARWWQQVENGDWAMDAPFWAAPNWISIAILCVLLLPQLSLGLSGFEMSMILMPQVRGRGDDAGDHPRMRIRNTRKVLLTAAVVMSVYLLGSVLVTSILIPEDALAANGPAANRALAYLAHGGMTTAGPAEELCPLLGLAFGSIYDVTTVLLLTLAGTSVMSALSSLLPQFLLRFGMELKWTARWGIMLMLFALVNLAVTLYFRANVEDQRGAYATGVLVVMSSACLVTVASRKVDLLKKGSRHRPWYFMAVACVFVVTTVAVIVMSPTGLLIAFGFIVTVLTMSVVVRAVRSDELRTIGFAFVNPESKALWESLRVLDFPVLVPHRAGAKDRDEKEAQIRCDHNLDAHVVLVFLEIELEDPSDFYQRLAIDVLRENHRYLIKVTQCVSVAHAIAAIALEMSRESKPPALHFGWSEMNLLAASWGYLAFGEGNIPSKVRELIHAGEPNPAKRPRVIVG